MKFQTIVASSLFVLVALAAQGRSFAQAPKKHTIAVKGQGQMAGGNGEFGVVYTLKNSFNFAIYGAHYTMAPFISSGTFAPKLDEKVFVIDIGFKNTLTSDNLFNPDHMFTAVDSKGQLYNSSNLGQDSTAEAGPNTNLKPGQGLGQPGLHDGVHVGFNVPGNARIVKILVNEGRKFVKPDESVIRYYVAGATKDEAGADGDPKNIVAPLPASVADPTDKSGAVALPEGVGQVGTYYPSWHVGLKLNSATTTTDSLMGHPPAGDMKYVVLNVTCKAMVQERQLSWFYIAGGNSPEWQVVDTDGERHPVSGFVKASSDAEANPADMQKGDEYTFRVVYTVPKAVTIKKIIIGALDGRKWDFDGSVIQ